MCCPWASCPGRVHWRRSAQHNSPAPAMQGPGRRLVLATVAATQSSCTGMLAAGPQQLPRARRGCAGPPQRRARGGRQPRGRPGRAAAGARARVAAGLADGRRLGPWAGAAGGQVGARVRGPGGRRRDLGPAVRAWSCYDRRVNVDFGNQGFMSGRLLRGSILYCLVQASCRVHTAGRACAGLPCTGPLRLM